MIRNAVLISGICALTACGGGSSNSTDRATQVSTKAVDIQFSAVVGSEALACGVEYTSVGTAASTTQIKDFRLFVHGIQLITDGDVPVDVTLNSSDWQAQGVVLLDFEDATGMCTGSAETNHVVSGTIPDTGATFTGVRFSVGVPENLNHLEQTSVSPFNVTGMAWNWTAGYKFMRFDVDNWNVHVGSTGCTANGSGDVICTNANRPLIQLHSFDYQTQSIQIDYAALVQDNDISTDAGGATGCMSGGTDPECNGVFTQLGLNLANGENDSGLTQTVFTVAN